MGVFSRGHEEPRRGSLAKACPNLPRRPVAGRPPSSLPPPLCRLPFSLTATTMNASPISQQPSVAEETAIVAIVDLTSDDDHPTTTSPYEDERAAEEAASCLGRRPGPSDSPSPPKKPKTVDRATKRSPAAFTGSRPSACASPPSPSAATSPAGSNDDTVAAQPWAPSNGSDWLARNQRLSMVMVSGKPTWLSPRDLFDVAMHVPDEALFDMIIARLVFHMGKTTDCSDIVDGLRRTIKGWLSRDSRLLGALFRDVEPDQGDDENAHTYYNDDNDSTIMSRYISRMLELRLKDNPHVEAIFFECGIPVNIPLPPEDDPDSHAACLATFKRRICKGVWCFPGVDDTTEDDDDNIVYQLFKCYDQWCQGKGIEPVYVGQARTIVEDYNPTNVFLRLPTGSASSPTTVGFDSMDCTLDMRNNERLAMEGDLGEKWSAHINVTDTSDPIVYDLSCDPEELNPVQNVPADVAARLQERLRRVVGERPVSFNEYRQRHTARSMRTLNRQG